MIDNNFYKIPQIDSKIEGMWIFVNKTYTTKEEAVTIQEKFKHEFDLQNESI